MLIAVGVALVCSAMVSTAVFLLRPIQAAYGAVERNRAITLAAGMATAEAPDDEVVAAYLDLEAIVFDLETGEIAGDMDGRSYDHWQSESGEPPRFVPVYLSTDGDSLERIVLPVDGQGMWSTIRGYIALEPDFDTVASLVIHQHGETPGIGDRIQQPEWLALWRGKRLHNELGKLSLTVSNDIAIPEQHRVDAITGATVTSQAVGRMIGKWFGPEGYGTTLAEALDSRGRGESR
jgi:Na+-transporting NADH:ubiquinone oxidoreductase subunit C